MKKLFAILTILCLCMYAVGCGPAETPVEEDPAPEANGGDDDRKKANDEKIKVELTFNLRCTVPCCEHPPITHSLIHDCSPSRIEPSVGAVVCEPNAAARRVEIPMVKASPSSEPSMPRGPCTT